MKLSILNKSQITEDFWIDFDELTSKSIRYNVNLNSKWLQPYIEFYLTNGDPCFFSFYSDNHLVGCIPFQIMKERATRFWDFRVFKVLGDGPSDFFDFPILEGYHQEVFELFSKHLFDTKNWDRIEFVNIPENSIGLDYFKNSVINNGLKPSIDIPNGFYYVSTKSDFWKDFKNEEWHLSNKDLMKSIRRISSDNLELSYERITKNVYERLIQHKTIYDDRRKTLNQFNYYNFDNFNKFLEKVIDNFEKENGVELTFLKNKNSEVLAMQLDWIIDGIRYHWNHAYNEDYKRYSPGKVLLLQILEKSFSENRILECNHMRGISSYKKSFTNNKVMLLRIRLENENSLRIKITRFVSVVLKYIKK